MRTPTKWTPKGSGTLPMGPTGLPEKVLLKQKFKMTLSSWVSNTWLSVRLSVRFSYPRVSNLLGPRSSNEVVM